MEAAVFGTQPGRTVGPIKTYAGWELVKVEAVHLAMLDDTIRETIKSLLFEDWLAAERVKARISIPLFEDERLSLSFVLGAGAWCFARDKVN